MDDLYHRVQAIMPEAISAWLDEEVDRKIKENAETVQSLRLEKLREFKSKLNALKKELPDLMNEEFNNQDSWSHNIENEEINRNTKTELQLNQFFRNIN